jgi:hypothetical protein
MLGGKGKGGRVGQRESPSGTEVSPCLRVANLQKIFFFILAMRTLALALAAGHAQYVCAARTHMHMAYGSAFLCAVRLGCVWRPGAAVGAYFLLLQTTHICRVSVVYTDIPQH